jgi:MFS family permease
MATHRQLKPWYFVLEGLNAYGTVLYFNYLFFHLQSRFGFGDLENLLVSASSGLLYCACAWYGGRAAQQYGRFKALKFGIGLLIVSMAAGTVFDRLAVQLAVMLLWTFALCFTWSSLEALASDHEPPGRLPRMIGIYNLVWAGGSAVAYFTGGAIWETLGPRSIFWVPLVLHGFQFALLWRLEPLARKASETPRAPPLNHLDHPDRPSPIRARLFLHLAWLANPFAYMAISTVVPLIPGLARRHELSPMWAGFFCSAWQFARLAAFLLLWQWPGWHYRMRWHFGALALLGASFLTVLLSSNLGIVLLAQLGLGLSCGLIYYASLFYSMDAGDTKSEHGGIHESAIGAGIFAGPAVGATGLWLAPQHPAAATWAVAGLLLIGLVASFGFAMRRSAIHPRAP